jgi:hypothetical protein
MNEYYWGFHLLTGWVGFLGLSRWDKKFRCNVLSAAVAAVLWVAVVYGIYTLGSQIAGITPGAPNPGTLTRVPLTPKLLLSFSFLVAAHPVASFITFLAGQYLIPGFKMQRLVHVWLYSFVFVAWMAVASMVASMLVWLFLGLLCLGWTVFARPQRRNF